MKSTQQKPITSSSKQNPSGNLLRKYYYLLGFFTFFIFANSIGNGYNMDDGIVTNGHELTSQGISALGEIFTSNYYKDNMGYAFGYRPMVHVSFAIEHELFGEKAGAGHFINVILFALSVVLFFKLIVKWVSEKNLLFAGIVATLFAIHPIHTEVVDSLKNRDELLAFLFVIWSALSAHKFLEKGKWTSVLSIVLLFSMAILSKKSVYPMVIVIPAAIILLKEISVKQLVTLCLSFIIPAAIFGSELQFKRAGLMLFLPMIILTFLYVIKTAYLSLPDVDLKKKFTQFKPVIYPILLISLVGFISVLFSSFFILLFTLPLFLWLFKVNYEIGLVTLFFLLLGLDALWLKDINIRILALIIGFGYSSYLFVNTRKVNALWASIGIISIVFFLFENFKLINAAISINLIIFIFLLQKKAIWAILFSLITVITVFYIDRISAYPILLLLISISLYFYQKTKNSNCIRYTAVIAFAILLGFIGDFNSRFSVISQEHLAEVTKQEKYQFVKNENILKEGRQLEYVENTLVADHTKEETIGTGFGTLGEYFRLMIFPYELSFYYGFAKTDTFNLKNVWVWLFILIHIGMLVLAFLHIKKNPLITIGVFWYLLCIILFSNWIELVAGMVGERLAFTASAGFCILITGVLFWIKPDLSIKKPGAVGYTLIVIMIVFTGRTIMRNTDWKDTITLMGRDISHLENSSQANNIYAMHLMAESTNDRSLTTLEVQEMQQKAIFYFNKAIKIWPDYYNVYIDKARATVLTGEYQEGIRSLEKAKKIDPNNEYSYYILLDILERTGDNNSYLKNAIKLFDLNQNEHAYGAVARGYFLLNDFQRSKEILLEGMAKYPNNEALKYNLTLVEQKLK